MISEFRFELLNDQNIFDLSFLFKDAFNEDRSLEQIKGKYSNKLSNGVNFSFIAYDSNNLPAGLYSLFPVSVRMGGEEILATQVGDIIIHSNYRKNNHNLFAKLSTYAHKHAENNGVKFVFGFVFGTNGSYPVFVRYLDFIDEEKYNGYNLKIPTLPLSNLSKKNFIFKQLYRPYFNLLNMLLLNEKDTFLLQDHDFGYGEIIKDINYIQYKKGFSVCKVVEIKKVRFLIKINKDGSLGVGDVDKNNPIEVFKAIKRLKLIAFLLGIRIIQFEVSEGHFIDKILSEIDTPVHNRRQIYVDFDEKYSGSKVKFTFADLDTY